MNSFDFLKSLEREKELRRQQRELMKDLKSIEKSIKVQREEKVIRILEKAVSKKRIKKIPPPTVPLPYHLVPRRLIQDLGLQPPLQIQTTAEVKLNPKEEKKRKEKMLAEGLMPIEVYQRKYDEELGKFLDTGSSKASFQLKEEGALEVLQGGQFVGLPKNEDVVTKILISKEDQLRDKLNRQVVFGQDNKPILNIGQGDELGLEGLDSDEEEEHKDDQSLKSQDLVDKMRMELAMDKQQQNRLYRELDIPKFDRNEKVVVNEEDVSDEVSEDGEDDIRNKQKTEQYQKIKERLKKGKLGKDVNINDKRIVRVIFKLSTSLLTVLNEVREQRNRYREQGIKDFNNALHLYNEVLRGWLLKCIKTPILTIIRSPDLSMDFIPLEGGIMRTSVKKERLILLQIRVNTIFTNLIQNANAKSFPQPLMTFMNSFMTEGGFVPYDFLTEFEQDILDFDTSDALMNFGPKQKFMFIGSFILSQFLIDRILMRPTEYGFNTDISDRSMENLLLLGAIIHGIFSEIMYDTFKQEMQEKLVLQANEVNRKEILEEFIYARYNYHKKLPSLELLDFAYEDNGSEGLENNANWWREMKEKCTRFIWLVYKLLDD